MLLPRLHNTDEPDPIDLGGDVELEYYRIQKMSSGAISLDDSDDATVSGPGDVGTGKSEEETEPLSQIIDRLNHLFGTDFAESERLLLQSVHNDAMQDSDMIVTARANDFDKFFLAQRPRLRAIMLERLAENEAFVNRCHNETDIGEVVDTGLMQAIFDAAHTGSSKPAS